MSHLKAINQGMVLNDGAKMSKSLGNTVDRGDDSKLRRDTVRLFMMFTSPPEQSLSGQIQQSTAHIGLKKL